MSGNQEVQEIRLPRTGEATLNLSQTLTVKADRVTEFRVLTEPKVRVEGTLIYKMTNQVRRPLFPVTADKTGVAAMWVKGPPKRTTQVQLVLLVHNHGGRTYTINVALE